MYDDPMDLDEEEDDEETLQLKLQEIQAQLRLKKLRKEKARATQGPATSFTSQTSDVDNGKYSRPDSASTSRPGHRIKEIRRTEPPPRPKSQPPPVEVPASPVRKANPPPPQGSPSRVLLGIDKGLTGKDISLKRAPSLRRPSDETGGGSQPGGYLRTSRSAQSFDETKRPLSFSERLKAARQEETTREEKRSKAARSRSAAFNVGREEMENYKSHATDIKEEPTSTTREFTREEILGLPNTDRSKTGYLQRSNTTSSARTASFPGSSKAGQGSPEHNESFTSTASDPQKPSSSASFEPYSCFHLNRRILPHQVVARAISGKTTYALKDLLRQVKSPDWSLPDDVIDCVVFAVVASKSDPRSHKPVYDPETGKMKAPDRGKYMVLTLVDLEYEVELYLFNTGFDRFWKLSTGTVVAILNPDIMPPPPGKQDTGRFSLAINSDADTILELGVARDLGYCKSVKADGKLCNSWVNARRTEHCEFHTNTALAKVRGARNELNGGGGFGREGLDYKRNRMGRYQSEEEKAKAQRREKVAEIHGKMDWETHSRYFVSGGGRGANSAEQGVAVDLAETREKAEGLKRRLAAKEKERDLAKKLSEMSGSGMGGQYMRVAATADPERAYSRPTRFGGGRTNGMLPPTAARFSPALKHPRIPLPGSQHEQEEEERKTDARSLGLLAPRGSEAPKIHLSPIKRKRQDSSTNSSFDSSVNPLPSRTSNLPRANVAAIATSSSSSSTNSTTGGFGWGTSLRDKLARMRDGERLSNHLPRLQLSSRPNLHAKTDSTSTLGSAFRDKDRSPVRKKTRFVTENGIREAGRESLPGGGGLDNAPTAAKRATVLRGASLLGGRSRGEVVLDDDEDEEMDELVVVR